ncbi:MAG: hypothetical protein R3E31_22820 [Chloroflexota bacterium]
MTHHAHHHYPQPNTHRTVEFLSTCTDGVELVVAYTFQNTRFTAAPRRDNLYR